MIRAHVKVDVKGTYRAEKRMAKAASAGTMQVAEAVVKHIEANWSSTSPSDRGAAPAKVSGKLERSVRLQARDTGGRFSVGGDIKSTTIQYTAPYAGKLEGDYLDRPFLEPALRAISSNMGMIFTKEVRQEMR